MKKILLIALLFLPLNAFALFGFGDDPVEDGEVEIRLSNPIRIVVDKIISPVYDEAKSNNKLQKFNQKIIAVIIDKYGNKQKFDLGVIVYDESQISELRKYKNKANAIYTKSEMYKFTVLKFMELDTDSPKQIN